jgi:hypothetical protein
VACCPDCPVVGDQIDAASVTVTVKRPDGNLFEVPAGLVGGVWRASVIVSQPGQWWFRAVSAGPIDVCERARLVGASKVLV